MMGPGGVVLYGDRIVAVFGGDSAIAADADVVIDGQGATLLPGLIDSRVHLSEPGLEYRETVGETARLSRTRRHLNGYRAAQHSPCHRPPASGLRRLAPLARAARARGCRPSAR